MQTRSRHVRRASAFVGLVAVGLGGYIAYASATQEAAGPTYSRTATKRCLEQRGFVATPSRVPDEPEHRDLYIDRHPSHPDTYPNLLFFDRHSQADDYAQGDSVPLMRRGNVVIGLENYGGANSLPTVRPLLACLRPSPS
jgi:hypothetical protein